MSHPFPDSLPHDPASSGKAGAADSRIMCTLHVSCLPAPKARAPLVTPQLQANASAGYTTPGMGASYNENSQIQRQAFEHFWPWLKDAVADSSVKEPFRQAKVIQYADFGCSGGGNSAIAFGKLKSVLEKAGIVGGDESSQIQVNLVDVPSNDWTKVADAFFRPGAVGCAENVLPSMVPRSFYAGIVAPASSLHIGSCVCAIQWLSHAPSISLKDSMCYAGGGHTHVEAFRQQFEADAEHFLRLRAAEFGPGGLLLIVAPGMLGDWYNGRGLMSSVADAAIELSAQGKINTALVEDFVWPIYFPTEDELVSAANRAGNWEVVQRGCTPLAHMWDAYQESEDSDTYAKTLISIMCGVGGPLLCERLAISEDTLQELREKAEELVRNDPTKYAFKNVQVAVLLRRTSGKW